MGVTLLFSIAPITHADDLVGIGLCNFDFYTSGSLTATDAKSLSDEKGKFENAFETKYQTGSCGEPNPSVGGLIEKGDCSNQVITEISEVVTTADTPVGEDRIVNLYQGVCCYISSGKTCYQTRTYYTEDYPTCISKVIGGPPLCSQRQWLIASSGMGLLKLYVKQIYSFGAVMVGFIAMAMLIYYGVRISTAGVSGDISEYKQKILETISGIVLLFLSALILYTVNPDFFG